MDSNYIQNDVKANQSIVSIIKEKRIEIYIAIHSLLIIASLILFFISQNIFMDNLAISGFIISCLLLIKTSGQTKKINN
ncbi:hypothetical protein BTO05_01905 [Winogradskyella sp. PC-19]|nr:hypothetical protein BTO05_01905 [Winogradskyella sp. PC-19]